MSNDVSVIHVVTGARTGKPGRPPGSLNKRSAVKRPASTNTTNSTGSVTKKRKAKSKTQAATKAAAVKRSASRKSPSTPSNEVINETPALEVTGKRRGRKPGSTLAALADQRRVKSDICTRKKKFVVHFMHKINTLLLWQCIYLYEVISL